jgi:hypothetical protein
MPAKDDSGPRCTSTRTNLKADCTTLCYSRLVLMAWPHPDVRRRLLAGGVRLARTAGRSGSLAVIGLVESMTDSRLAIRRTRSAARGDPGSAAPAMARAMNLPLDRCLIMCGQDRTTATD